MAKFQLLKCSVSLQSLILTSIYWTLYQQCNADASWNNFALCPGCTGKRLEVSENLFQPRLIGKGSSLIWVRMDCSHSCANQDSCYAFNFYENENFYVCELLSDNFRRNKAALQLIDHPGCSVWEKLSTGMDSDADEISTETTPAASKAMTQSSTETISKSSTGTNPVSNEISTETTTETSTAMTQSSTGTSTTSSTRTTSSSTKRTASLSTSMALPTTKATPQNCTNVRPGCLGTYPSCHSCIKTCVDYTSRKDVPGPNVYLWPDGDGPDSVPIRAVCGLSETNLIERFINLASKTEDINYSLSFNDMHRLIKLNVYPYLRILFRTRVQPSRTMTDASDYKNFFISPNGTLSNLTYVPSASTTVDVLNLNGQPMKPTRFVNVTNDRYGCGSFWLLDTTNATYCPGGATGMFGTLRTSSALVLNTGIRLSTTNGVTFYVRVALKL